ncbi:MAG: hypothetical protein H6744_16115 [Deltaproteobacteria bacterium]|nr:hypothetical protein [Deltaproteobacteria bacterium]MCB9788208.1 hypothetical protein [Deltaproteobacteria bacterium]
MPHLSRTLLSMILLGSALVAACEDSGSGAGGGADSAGDVGLDFGLPDAIVDAGADLAGSDGPGPGGPPTLDFAAATGDDGESCRGEAFCAVIIDPSESRKLEVVVSEGGVPVADRVVTFKIDGDAAGVAQISALSAYSDAEGRASVELQVSGEEPAWFRVRAQLSGAEVAPVTFEVVVAPDARVPLTVRPSYAGELDIAQVAVRAFAQSAPGVPGCGDPVALLEGQTAAAGEALALDLGRPARFLELPAGSYTLVASGASADGTVVALGCDADHATVSASSELDLPLPMEDRAPRFSGTFDMTASVPMGDVLSGPWSARSAPAFSLLDGEPSALALRLCGLGAADTALATLCGQLFNDPLAPAADDATETGKAAIAHIAQNVGALQDQGPWKAALAGGGSTRGVIERLELRGSLRLLAEPTGGAWTEDQAQDVWDAVVARYGEAVPCPEPVEPGCGKKKLFFAMFQPDSPVGGAFSATITQSLLLSVGSHDLGLRYGAMVDAVLERALLPVLLGEPTATRWEDLIALALGGPGCLAKTGAEGCCARFATALGESQPGANNPMVTACEAWITAGAQSLRAPMVGAADAAGAFTSLGTREPCPAVDDDADLVIDRLGAAETPCTFDLVVGDEEDTVALDLGVYGVRAP